MQTSAWLSLAIACQSIGLSVKTRVNIDSGIDEALRIAERLRRALSASTFPWEGRRFNVSCSIGIARVTADQMEVSDVLRAADRACYQAKERWSQLHPRLP